MSNTNQWDMLADLLYPDIDKTPEYPTKIYHTGDNGGFQAYLAKYPEKDISIIILENRNDNDRWTLATSIDQILKEEGYI